MVKTENHGDLADTADIRPAIHRRLTEMKFGPINVFGVAAANTSHDLIWDVYKIYAYINISKYYNVTYYCCLKYSNYNSNRYYRIQTASTFLYAISRRYGFGIYHFVCPNIKHRSGVVPTGVAITVTGASCLEYNVVYLEPSYPLKMPGQLLIGVKVAFQNLNPNIVIEWMEAYRYLGVDKVVGYYVPDLNEKARRVLNYYAATGFLDLYLFHQPWEGTWILTVFILVDFPIHFNIISMDLSILYFECSQIKRFKFYYITVPEDCYFLSKQ